MLVTSSSHQFLCYQNQWSRLRWTCQIRDALTQSPMVKGKHLMLLTYFPALGILLVHLTWFSFSSLPYGDFPLLTKWAENSRHKYLTCLLHSVFLVSQSYGLDDSYPVPQWQRVRAPLEIVRSLIQLYCLGCGIGAMHWMVIPMGGLVVGKQKENNRAHLLPFLSESFFCTPYSIAIL